MTAPKQVFHLPDSVDIVLSGLAEDLRISQEELITLALNCYIKTSGTIDAQAVATLKDGKKQMHDNAWDMAWFAFQSEVEEAEIHHRLKNPKKVRGLITPKPKDTEHPLPLMPDGADDEFLNALQPKQTAEPAPDAPH